MDLIIKIIDISRLELEEIVHLSKISPKDNIKTIYEMVFLFTIGSHIIKDDKDLFKLPEKNCIVDLKTILHYSELQRQITKALNITPKVLTTGHTIYGGERAISPYKLKFFNLAKENRF
jgi:hypothetical protein